MGSNQSNLAKKVDLSGKGISKLEEDMLPTFPRLEHIDLHKNKIEQIPESIVQDLNKSPLVVEHLQVLNLKKNRLAEVPPCVYTLGSTPSAGSNLFFFFIYILFSYRRVA